MGKRINYDNINICDYCGNKLIQGSTYQEYDKKGYLVGHSCKKCHNRITRYDTANEENIEIIKQERKLIKKNKQKDVTCAICGSGETYIYNGDNMWHKPRHIKGLDVNKDLICSKCYHSERRKRQEAWWDTVKIVTKSRKPIDLDSIKDLNERQKGLAIEHMVCRTINIANRNIEEDNFNAKTDTLQHYVYGYIEIKCSSLNIRMREYRICEEWNFGTRNTEFDTLIIICMDKYWNCVERVYIIPCDDVGVVGITIYKYTKYMVSKWEKFRVDEKPFDETWQIMKKERYICI